MDSQAALPHRASLAEYEQQAVSLLAALRRRDEAAAWRFKWEHPRFRDRPVTDVHPADLTLDDARIVVARAYAFDSWDDLAAFTEAVAPGSAVDGFETAVEAVVSGDAAALRTLLRENPNLVQARSPRRHHATLLHYLGANGVEGGRQKTPANAVEMARILLEAGAEPDALADLYGKKCTTLSMLVSSSHPAAAGLQIALAETLLDHGAALEGAGTRWRSPILTALTFGYLDTARALAERGVPPDDLAIAAGLGRVEAVRRLLPQAKDSARHIALALSAQLGHAPVVRLLLDGGEDPNRYNPDGFHAHATPLHHAVCYDRLDVVRVLVESGARLDLEDTIYRSTPLGWARSCGRAAIAEFLEQLGAP
jgi:ankyrin repeat protein